MQGTQPLARGLWGVLATPFTADAAAVDEASLRREVAYQLECGATGLVVLGVFGEAAQLGAAERLAVIRVVDDVAAGTPLVIGIAERDTGAVIESAGRALDVLRHSAGSLMIQVQSGKESELAEHLHAIHRQTSAGIVVQDYPVVSGISISPAELLAGIGGCDFVVAVKSESPPTSAAIAELTAASAVPVFGGLGGLGLLDELAVGASGAMTGFSYPEALLATITAWDAGGYPSARAAFLPWLPLVNFEAQARIGLAIRKASLAARDIFASDAVRAPAAPMPAALRPVLRQHVAHLPGAQS
jgi:4-hydroxy-tetrahydrodipicolinate synthase